MQDVAAGDEGNHGDSFAETLNIAYHSSALIYVLFHLPHPCKVNQLRHHQSASEHFLHWQDQHGALQVPSKHIPGYCVSYIVVKGILVKVHSRSSWQKLSKALFIKQLGLSESLWQTLYASIGSLARRSKTYWCVSSLRLAVRLHQCQ